MRKLEMQVIVPEQCQEKQCRQSSGQTAHGLMPASRREASSGQTGPEQTQPSLTRPMPVAQPVLRGRTEEPGPPRPLWARNGLAKPRPRPANGRRSGFSAQEAIHVGVYEGLTAENSENYLHGRQRTMRWRRRCRPRSVTLRRSWNRWGMAGTRRARRQRCSRPPTYLP